MTVKFADARNAHLTDEQFSDYVLGLASAEVEAHIAQCPPCYAEVAELKSSIATFSSASHMWSASQPAPSLGAMRRKALLYSMRPVAGFAMAVVAVISVAIPVGRSQREAARPAEVQTAAVAAPAAPQVTEADDAPIAVAPKPVHTARLVAASLPRESESVQQDNAIMSAISDEIASPVSGTIQSVVSSASGQ